jgi:hypothetical protein
MLAGMSTVYALRVRTPREYLTERAHKLLLPTVTGILLLSPAIAYYAERFHEGFDGNYFQSLKLYFSNTENLLVRRTFVGGVSPNQLWFLAYLFVFNVAALAVQIPTRRCGFTFAPKITLAGLFGLFVPVWGMSALLNINVTAANGVGNMLACFLAGMFLLSSDESHALMEKYRWLFFSLYITALCGWALGFLSSNGIITPLEYAPRVVNETFNWLAAWTGCLMTVGFARRGLNRSDGIWKFLQPRAFPIYVFHMVFVVPTAYYVVTGNVITSKWLRFIIILASGFGGSLLLYEAVQHIPTVGFLFGLGSLGQRHRHPRHQSGRGAQNCGQAQLGPNTLT